MRMSWFWRCFLSSSRQGRRLILVVMSVEAPQSEATGDHERWRIFGQALWTDVRSDGHGAERVGDRGGGIGGFLNRCGSIGNDRATAGQQDVIDLVVLTGAIEELQRSADLLRHRFFEWLQHLFFVIIRQPTLAFGAASFLIRQAVAAHDLFGELLAAEDLLARVDNLATGDDG